MTEEKNLLKRAKEFFDCWFVQRNKEAAGEYLSQDVSFVGTVEGEKLCGKQEMIEYIAQDIEESKTSFDICYFVEEEAYIAEGAGTVLLGFEMKNQDFEWRGNTSFVLSKNCEEETWLICRLHFSMPTPVEENTEHYPATAVRKNITRARHELLAASIAGGIMGCYDETDLPFYFINRKMLEYLGYDSEEDFRQDISGYLINCIHPEDRETVMRTMEDQLISHGEYAVEYRMKKRNGDYIYIQDIGRTITAEDGREVILSVCVDVSTQRFEKQQNESLIRALNGGNVICKSVDNRYIPIYMSAGLGGLTGYTREELEEMAASDILQTIHPKDRTRLMSSMNRALKGMDSVEGTYRIRNKAGEYIWITAIFCSMGEQDGVPLLHCVFTSMSHEFELQNNILDGTDTGIYVIDPDTYELCLANEAAFRILDTRFCDYIGRKCYEVFGGYSEPCSYCVYDKDGTEPKEMYIPHLERNITLICRKAVCMGKDVVIKYLHDVTEQRQNQERLKISEQRLATAIRHAGVQFWEYNMQHDRGYISEYTADSFGIPRVIENYPEGFLRYGLIHPSDEDAYRRMHEQLKAGAKEVMLEFRIRKPGADYSWELAHYTSSFDEAGHPIRAIATSENIDRYKEQEEQFTVAAKVTGVRVWVVDLQNKTISLSQSRTKDLQIYKTVPCETMEQLYDIDFVYREDVPALWEKIQELYVGADNVSLRVRLKAGDKYRWNKLAYTVMKTKNGVPVKAIGSSVDVHEHVLLEQRFEQEMEYSTGLSGPNLVSKAQCNVTRGTVDIYKSGGATSVSRSGGDYREGVEGLAKTAVEKEKQEQIRYLLNRERVLQAYAEGEDFYSVDYLRKSADGKVFWVNTLVRSYQNPSTGDIMSFMYTYNIDEQKTTEAIIKHVVDTQFEYLTLINMITGAVEKTIDKTGMMSSPETEVFYEATVEEELSGILLEKAKNSGEETNLISCIRRKLEQKGTYSVSSELIDNKEQEKQYKLWVFNWFDKEHTRVLCSRSDITEAQRQEQQKKEALSAALMAAKQANTAKSDFLSRMSHEIRTPMNAIIGMTNIAAKSIGDDEKVADCISKIDSSSKFLLSLINDILDMSRIESGKMLLRNEKIYFVDFIEGINAICGPQATVKRLAYECIIQPTVEECYMGDAMKLQQVLVNIIGNAVKFTEPGGKITFSVTQSDRTLHDAKLRFIIRDTGIGMSSEFLPNLFSPFEQESTGITSVYGGTGLGLSISKNIVDLMDGRIRVNSVKGRGTEFVVDIKLGVTEESKRKYSGNLHETYFAPADAEVYDFTGKRILLVEDHPINAEIAKVLLEDVGFQVETAENGLRAVEMFAASAPGYYAAILMDIRMPVMDGLEASGEIRKLDKKDARTIPIIAMTADAFDEDADKSIAAGMNMHLAKPIDPPGLYQVLYQFLI